MVDLTQLTVDAGGIGVVYWEPNWVSTKCGTRWGKGSDWENATWFDYPTHEALPVFEFLRHKYRRPKKGERGVAAIARALVSDGIEKALKSDEVEP